MARILCFISLIIIGFSSCKNRETRKEDHHAEFNRLAENYVRLGLFIGQYDPSFVDAYYGPDSLRPAPVKDTFFPRDSLLQVVNQMISSVARYSDTTFANDTLQLRAGWIGKQLQAFGRRIRWVAGEKVSFDREAKELFDVEPPHYSEHHFKSLIVTLDSLLPGKGNIQERVLALSKEFIIPKNKVDTVFKAAYNEARKRTIAQMDLPAGEKFQFEYVTGKPWSGYNWYKGNYTSLIQQNLDLPIAIERAIDLACHEGYPGHHVYNMLLEKNLYRDKGWVEISLYPLYSPQSLIAEGSANFGIEMTFPGEEKNRFAKQVLFPLAGLDTANADIYFQMLEIKSKLNYARNEAARGVLDGTLDDESAIQWMMDYMLVSKAQAEKYLSFIKANHSYVICYNYGLDLVKNYIENNGGTVSSPAKRWALFRWLLSNPVTPRDLLDARN
ncbi:MAG TPA: hypothetical protein VGC29_11010 [Flavisolibacter sp.]